MPDHYASIWSIVFWSAAGGLLLLAAVAASPIGKGLKDRAQGIAGALLLGAMCIGIGFAAQGSRSRDTTEVALRRANMAVLEAQANVRQAESAAAATAVRPSSSDIISTDESMDFETCLGRIRAMANKRGAPANIVETSDVRIVRFPVSDGSVLVTCSRPDHKMILTRSPHR